MNKLLLSCIASAFCAVVSLGTAGPALSAVFTPGPQELPSPPGNAFPKWYTAPLNPTPPPLGGLSLTPCLSPTVDLVGLPMCVLLPEPGFNPALPVVFSSNFPSESFYFIADAIILDLGGGNRATYRAAVEAAFANGVPAAGQQITFARVRFTISAPVSGTYRITHPFGQAVFPGVTAGPAAIRVQEDIGQGAPGGPFGLIDTPVGAASQAGGGLQQFLVRSVGGVATPIVIGNEMFIGDPNLEQAVVGGTQPSPNNPATPFNAFMVEVDTGAGFVQLGRTDNFNLAGQIIGLIVTPPAQGTDFGVWKLNSASTARTFTLQNLSPMAITPVISATSNNLPSPDFTIVPSTCGAVVAAGASCNFDVVFNTSTAGARSAAINVSGGAAVPPAALTTVTGTGDALAPVLANVPDMFSKLSTATISGTASDNFGVPAVQVSLNGTIQGAATVTNGAWSMVVGPLTTNSVNNISVTATDGAQPAPGNQTVVTATVTHDNVLPVVSLTEPANDLLINKPALQALTFAANDLNLAATVVKLDGAIVTPPPLTLETLTDGAHTIAVEATDSAGNVSVALNNIVIALSNGDLSNNGSVGIEDALQALRIAVDLSPQPTPNTVPFFHGDVAPLGSPNGTVDIADALLILRKVVGLVNF
jgi:hypothetical protein